MRVAFRLVDVFTDQPLAGNQLCVFPGPTGLPADLMQAVAKEIGFSETTFITEASGDRYEMRIFTPGTELAFAGHPSLGTAFVLVAEGRVTNPVTQSVAAGEFPLVVDLAARSARMRQLAPAFGTRVDDRAAVAAAVGLDADDLRDDPPAQMVSTGLGHLTVPARHAEAVARARPDAAALAELLAPLGTDGYYLFAVEDDGPDGARAKARFFGTGIGIVEDPATGSAAGPVGAYAVRYGLISSNRLTISQGEELGRPSTLFVEVERDGDDPAQWRVFVGGGVAIVGEGSFDLDA